MLYKGPFRPAETKCYAATIPNNLNIHIVLIRMKGRIWKAHQITVCYFILSHCLDIYNVRAYVNGLSHLDYHFINIISICNSFAKLSNFDGMKT